MSLRISALRDSTEDWARSMALVTILASMGWSSGRVRVITHDSARGEETHEVVFERKVEPALARVALTAGSAAELVVDAAGFVALAAEHVEAAEAAHLVALGFAGGLEPGK